MKFLIIMAVVIMVHHGEWMHYFQRDAWFESWSNQVSQQFNKLLWLPFLLTTLLPAFAVAGILLLFGGNWLVAFLVNALVLLFSIGRDSWRNESATWVEFFSKKENPVNGNADGNAVGDVGGIWEKARSDVLYHHLDAFYTTVFWFFVPFAGAPVALFYRLLHFYQQHEKTRHGELPDMSGLLWMLEWLPVRLMALLFCLVGNFTTGFWVLKQVLLDTGLTSTDALARCADAALFIDGSVDETIDDAKERTAKVIERMEARSNEQKTLAVMRRYSVELQALLERVEVAFLVVVAILALI